MIHFLWLTRSGSFNITVPLLVPDLWLARLRLTRFKPLGGEKYLLYYFATSMAQEKMLGGSFSHSFINLLTFSLHAASLLSLMLVICVFFQVLSQHLCISGQRSFRGWSSDRAAHSSQKTKHISKKRRQNRINIRMLMCRHTSRWRKTNCWLINLGYNMIYCTVVGKSAARWLVCPLSLLIRW